MLREKPSQLPKTLWAYAYQIVPPQAEDRLHTIQGLLDHEHSEARRWARTWAGRVVALEQQITHILVVSDSPEQNLEVNRRLEAELQELKASFSMTVPLAVDDDPPLSPMTERRSGVPC